MKNKSFISYLIESAEEKKYAFKVKIAGPLPENCEDCMETALQKYQVSKFTKGKSTPIQENLIDFPDIKNSEMTVFEVEVDYPATSAVIAELLANSTGIDRNAIRVRTPAEEENWQIEHENELTDKTKDEPALLNSEYEKSNAQDLVGEKHVTGFLKGLTKQRKEQPHCEQYTGVNDELLAKKMHSEKANEMPAAGPARSLFGETRKD